MTRTSRIGISFSPLLDVLVNFSGSVGGDHPVGAPLVCCWIIRIQLDKDIFEKNSLKSPQLWQMLYSGTNYGGRSFSIRRELSGKTENST